MNKQHILVDCDGVLLDPVLGFIKWFILNFPNINVTNVIKYDASFISECFLSFWNSPAFAKIPILKTAKYPIEFLKEKYNISVVTSCGDDNTKRIARIKNLEDCFGKNTFKDIYTLPFNKSKKEIYKIYNDAIVIDDELNNIIDAKSCNLKQVFWIKYYPLIKSIAYNKNNKSINRKFPENNWNNIISNIIKEQSR